MITDLWAAVGTDPRDGTEKIVCIDNPIPEGVEKILAVGPSLEFVNAVLREARPEIDPLTHRIQIRHYVLTEGRGS